MDTTFNDFDNNASWNSFSWNPGKMLFLLVAGFVIYADMTYTTNAVGHCRSQISSTQ